jgi:hypothetical protein
MCRRVPSRKWDKLPPPIPILKSTGNAIAQVVVPETIIAPSIVIAAISPVDVSEAIVTRPPTTVSRAIVAPALPSPTIVVPAVVAPGPPREISSRAASVPTTVASVMTIYELATLPVIEVAPASAPSAVFPE